MKAKFKVSSISDSSVFEKVEGKMSSKPITRVTLKPLDKGDILSPINLNDKENTFAHGEIYEVEITFKKAK